jgi:hypothetical protein
MTRPSLQTLAMVHESSTWSVPLATSAATSPVDLTSLRPLGMVVDEDSPLGAGRGPR